MRNALVLALTLAHAVATTVSADVHVMFVGDDDGFGGTQGAQSAPGQPFAVFASPAIAPGSWSGPAATDVATVSPWTPYVFTFSFAIDVPQYACVGSAEVRIQHGSVARRTNGSGFGFATVTASLDGAALPAAELWPSSTGSSGSVSEESVKLTVLDVSALVQPGASGILTVKVDGSMLASPVDQFAFDFVALRIEGQLEECPPDLDCSAFVDGADLGMLLASWGSQGADLNGDGTTDGADLGMLLAAWGPCG